MATVYIADPDTELRFCSQHLEIHRVREGEPKHGIHRRIPLFDIDRVVILTGPYVTLRVIVRCLEEKIPVTLLSRSGRLIGSFTPPRDGDATVRLLQYQLGHDATWTLKNAIALVQAKLLNSRRVLQKLASSRVSAQNQHS